MMVKVLENLQMEHGNLYKNTQQKVMKKNNKENQDK